MWSPIVEQVSIDEAYLDLAGTEQLHGNSTQVAGRLKQSIKETTGLSISVGGGPNKLIAKIASGASKPDGLLIIPDRELGMWLAPRPVREIPGIGPVAQSTLRELGITTCGQLAHCPDDHLLRRFGPHGPALKLLARGEDDSAVDPGGKRKSLGREMTLEHNVSDLHVLETLLFDLAESVSYSLRQERLLARTVSLKLKDTEFQSIARQVKLAQPSNLSRPIFEASRGLLNKEAQGEPYRLIGISTSELGDSEQLSIFDRLRSERERNLTGAADRLRNKYGEEIVARARLIDDTDPKDWR